jgi:hypothetical protein
MSTDQTTTLRTEPAPLAEVRNDLTHHARATWVVTRRELLRFKQDRARMFAMLLPALSWFGWKVPVGVQLLTVAVITAGLIGLAARMFRTTE